MKTVIMLSLNIKLVFNYISLTANEVQLLTYTRASQNNTHLKQNRNNHHHKHLIRLT